MSWLIATFKFLGWWGLLALVLLAMLAFSNGDRDRQAQRADKAELALLECEQRVGRKSDALRTAAAALKRDAATFKAIASNNTGWNSAIDTVSGVLRDCQAENVRLSAAGSAAMRKAAAVEAKAAKRLSGDLQKWDNRSDECTAAAKLMEAKCDSR